MFGFITECYTYAPTLVPDMDQNCVAESKGDQKGDFSGKGGEEPRKNFKNQWSVC